MNLTLLVILLIVAFIIIYDFVIIYNRGKYESISAWIIRLSRKYPSIPFLVGFVCGHLFWSMDTNDWKIPDKPAEQIEKQESK